MLARLDSAVVGAATIVDGINLLVRVSLPVGVFEVGPVEGNGKFVVLAAAALTCEEVTGKDSELPESVLETAGGVEPVEGPDIPDKVD